MASYFFDSSAIAKRYHREPGTDWVQSVCDPRNHPPMYLSQLAQVEVVAALRRTGRHDQLHPSFVDVMVNTFERHLVLSDPSRARPMYLLVPLTAAILAFAGALCNKYWDIRPHPLRSLDALQLASALGVASTISDELFFVSADSRLAAIAPLEGLTVIHPAYTPHP